MSPLVTSYPPSVNPIFNKPLYEEVRQFVPKISTGNYYYLVSDVHFSHPNSLSENILTYTSVNSQIPFSDQLNLIAFANMIFQDSKPMSGLELKILKNTATRLLSKTPTSLRNI
jgi:hypothetical protein